MRPIGVFGGTFDPIHFGHLRTAFELREILELDEVRFLPAGDPPHRGAPLADGAARVAMARAATQDQPGFVVDDREVRRAGPSYTVTTLAELRAELPETPICLIVGMDAFQGLQTWHRWREIPDLAHLVVAHRPGWSPPGDGPLRQLLDERATQRAHDLHERPAGRVFVHAVTQLEISSTDLRELVVSGRDPRYLLPDPVRDYIRDRGCYFHRSTR